MCSGGGGNRIQLSISSRASRSCRTDSVVGSSCESCEVCDACDEIDNERMLRVSESVRPCGTGTAVGVAFAQSEADVNEDKEETEMDLGDVMGARVDDRGAEMDKPC